MIVLIDEPFPRALYHTTNKIFSGVHYSVRHRIKNDYLWWFKEITPPAGVPDMQGVHLSFTFTFAKKHRLYDCDNCSFMGKMITDCLVKEGIFEDDTSKYISAVTYRSIKGTSNHLLVTAAFEK